MAQDFGDIWRIATSRDMSVASAGGASVSTAVFGAQCYAIQINFPGSTSSTSGVRFNVGSASVAATSTGNLLLSPNWPYILKVSAGQTLAAISNDAGSVVVNVTELTK